MATPTIGELLARLEEQQARIELLESRSAAPPAGPVAGTVPEPDQRPSLLTRRGLVRGAAIGTAGLVGGMLVEPGAALASTTAPHGPESFASSTTTPAITATNTGKGNAITATGASAAAIHGSQKSAASGTSAIKGTIDGKNGAGIGVWGKSPAGSGVTGDSATGIGVTGTSESTAASASAIQGTITSNAPGDSSAGVRGINNGTGGAGFGVYGSQAGAGFGVYGHTPAGVGVVGECGHGVGVQAFSDSGGYGVYASTGDGNGYGVYAQAYNGFGVHGATGGGTGVHGSASGGTAVEGVADSGTGVKGASSGGYGVYGSSPNNYAVIGVTTSGTGAYGQVSAKNQAGVIGRQEDASGNWAIYGFGNIGATGTKSAVVPAEDGGDHLTLYCMESPECWFEDFGSSKLARGSATVHIDPEFAQTIHTGDYLVFVQAEGECKGLSVRSKTATGFVVRELGGGTSSASFAYRIVARRKDVAAPRLNRIALPDAPRHAV
jgi:hypothetical protein